MFQFFFNLKKGQVEGLC